MAKVAVVVLAGTETHEGLARVVNALETVKEFKEAQDDVKLIFDGAGTAWVPELAKQDHRAHRLFATVRDRVSGVCSYCAGAFGVKGEVQACEVPLLGEYEGHPSLRNLVVSGYQVIIF
jgi:hypothetical protein